MHHALLAHAQAVDVFRKGGYKGRIGIKVDGTPGVPLNASSQADLEAVTRTNDFEVCFVCDSFSSRVKILT